MTTPPTMGTFALLRAAGLPVRGWQAAAAPDLFDALRRLEDAHDRYRCLGTALAERLGTDVVTHPDLSKPDRRRVLALRRLLHAGTPAAAGECARVRAVVALLGADPAVLAALDTDLDTADLLAAEIHERTAAVAAAVPAERDRLLPLPWHLLTGDPVGRRLLADSLATTAADVRRRLHNGEPWTSKRMRRRSDYLWRMIARGTVKTTPRGWFGHLAYLPVDDRERAAIPLQPSLLPPMADRFAISRAENVHSGRRDLAVSGRLTDDTLIALAPLRLTDGERERFWVIDPVDRQRVREVSVHRTPLLAALQAAIGTEVLTTAAVRARVLPPDADAHQHAVLTEVLGRLATMGILQVSTVPAAAEPAWQSLATAEPRPAGPAAADEDDETFLDVYRGVDGALAGCVRDRLEEAILQVVRLQEIMRVDRAVGPGNHLRLLDAAPKPLLQVIAHRLDERERQAPPAPREPVPRLPGMAAATTPGSTYADLLARLDASAATSAAAPGGTTPVRLDADLLDRIGAPRAEPAWPIDCTLRPVGAGYTAVLDMMLPAGTLDARFAAALETLHGPLPHVAAYREFLAALHERTGVEPVEILVPPLGSGAANAVRRPAYTERWTGDPDPSAYGRAGSPGWRSHLSLTDLSVHRDGDVVVVTAGGRPVHALYHSMRTVRWPWDLVVRLLTVDTPRERYGYPRPRLRLPLVAFPHRDYLPRIDVDGALTLFPAQWRVRREELGDQSAGDLARLRTLTRLRDRLGLPRFVVAHSSALSKPLPCDLESLGALDVLARALDHPTADGPAGRATELIVEEMLPAPGELTVCDRAGEPHVSEIMIRLPGRLSPAALADRTAHAFTAWRRDPHHIHQPSGSHHVRAAVGVG